MAPAAESSSVDNSTDSTVLITKDDLRSILILDKGKHQILVPMAQGAYSLSKFIPCIVGHTAIGYAFKFYNSTNSAMKHFNRAEFNNKNLAHNIDKQAINWVWLTDAKTSDQRATIPYLLQQLCADYNEQEEERNCWRWQQVLDSTDTSSS